MDAQEYSWMGCSACLTAGVHREKISDLDRFGPLGPRKEKR